VITSLTSTLNDLVIRSSLDINGVWHVRAC